MNVKEGYDALLCLKRRQQGNLGSDTLRYFTDNGLVHVLCTADYTRLHRLLDECNTLDKNVSNLYCEQCMLRSSHPFTDAEGQKYWRYKHLSRRSDSRLHRWISTNKQLKAEAEELDILAAWYQDHMRMVHARLPEVDRQLSEKRDTLKDVTQSIDELSRTSQAMLRHGGLGGYYTKWWENYYETTDGKYSGLTHKGELVVEGIEAAKVQDNTEYECDLALELIGNLVTTWWEAYCSHKPQHVTNSVRWDEVDVLGTLCTMRRFRTEGKQYQIKFTPGYSVRTYEHFEDSERDVWESHPQSFGIVEESQILEQVQSVAQGNATAPTGKPWWKCW